MDENKQTMEQPNDETLANANETYSENKNEAAQSHSGSIAKKFKDIKSLEEAYENLQAEFTKKCQRLSELEKSSCDNAPSGAPQKADDEQKTESDAGAENGIDLENEDIIEKVLTIYAQKIKASSPPLVSGRFSGGSVPLRTAQAPKTLDEAKEIVKNLLSN